MNPQQIQQLVTEHARYAGEWTPFMQQEPPIGSLVRFWHEYTGTEWTGYIEGLSPMQGVGVLWWKLTGIERMRCTTTLNDLR